MMIKGRKYESRKHKTCFLVLIARKLCFFCALLACADVPAHIRDVSDIPKVRAQYSANSFPYAKWHPSEEPCPLDINNAVIIASNHLRSIVKYHSSFNVDGVILVGTLQQHWFYGVRFRLVTNAPSHKITVRVAFDGSIIDATRSDLDNGMPVDDSHPPASVSFSTPEYHQFFTNTQWSTMMPWRTEGKDAKHLNTRELFDLAEKAKKEFMRADTTSVVTSFEWGLGDPFCIVLFTIMEGTEKMLETDHLNREVIDCFAIAVGLDGYVPKPILFQPPSKDSEAYKRWSRRWQRVANANGDDSGTAEVSRPDIRQLKQQQSR